MNRYEQKQADRQARLEAAAERAERESKQRFKAADSMLSIIPPGQPILVGHHSEGRHRRHLARIDNNIHKGVEASKRAAELRSRAAGVGSAGISSDDPEALDKLREKLAKLEQKQQFMRETNKLVRKAQKLEEPVPFLADALNQLTERLGMRPFGNDAIPAACKLLEPDFCGRFGYPDYALTNNNGNMRRIRQRIQQLEAREATRPDTETVTAATGPGWRIVENFEENRLQILFDAKPSAEIRGRLKAHGFRWARTAGAWQRHLNEHAKQLAIRICNEAQR